METSITHETGFVVALILLSLVWFISLILVRLAEIRLEKARKAYKEAQLDELGYSEKKLFIVRITYFHHNTKNVNVVIKTIFARSSYEALGEMFFTEKFKTDWLILGGSTDLVPDEQIKEAASILTKIDHKLDKEEGNG